MRVRWFVVAVTTVVVVGCGDDTPAAPTFAISGLVRASPTCPVEQPGQECPPAPVVGAVRVLEGDGLVGETTSDAAGRFAIEVPAGSYTVVVDTGSAFPICPPTTVTVEAGPVEITIDCDTGIR